jgi:hypothetical protein
LPRIWSLLWFSITTVNTVPFQPAGRLAAPVESGRQLTDVLPESFGPVHPTSARAARRVEYTVDDG